MISIIIPTLNEEAGIGKLVTFLKQSQPATDVEIIVSDGGSTDRTIMLATEAGATVLRAPASGRASQMNFGAIHASGDILYFVHADCVPPQSFAKDMLKAVTTGYHFGRFRTRFDRRSPLLAANAFFTRFDMFVCYGGDQTLFMTRELFKNIGGFSEEMKIMEDYEIVTRAKTFARYLIIQKDVLVSARKYEHNSWLQVQLANYRIVNMYKRGATQEEMVHRYKESLLYR